MNSVVNHIDKHLQSLWITTKQINSILGNVIFALREVSSDVTKCCGKNGSNLLSHCDKLSEIVCF